MFTMQECHEPTMFEKVSEGVLNFIGISSEKPSPKCTEINTRADITEQLGDSHLPALELVDTSSSQKTSPRPIPVHQFYQSDREIADSKAMGTTTTKYFNDISRMNVGFFGTADGYISSKQIDAFLQSEKGLTLSEPERKALGLASQRSYCIEELSKDGRDYLLTNAGISRNDLNKLEVNAEEMQLTLDAANYMRSNWSRMAVAGRGVNQESWETFKDERIMSGAGESELKVITRAQELFEKHSEFKFFGPNNLSLDGLKKAVTAERKEFRAKI